MMDCKRALTIPEVAGDINKAIEWLRKKGVAKVLAKGNERAVSEGLIGMFIDSKNNKVTLVEVNSETDFVGRNTEFQKFVASVAATVSQHFATNQIINSSDILQKPFVNIEPSKVVSTTVNNQLEDIISRIREPISIARAINISPDDVSKSIAAEYIHGRIGIENVPAHIQVST